MRVERSRIGEAARKRDAAILVDGRRAQVGRSHHGGHVVHGDAGAARYASAVVVGHRDADGINVGRRAVARRCAVVQVLMTDAAEGEHAGTQADDRIDRAVAPVDCHRVAIQRARIGEVAAQRGAAVLVDRGRAETQVQAGRSDVCYRHGRRVGVGPTVFIENAPKYRVGAVVSEQLRERVAGACRPVTGDQSPGRKCETVPQVRCVRARRIEHPGQRICAGLAFCPRRWPAYTCCRRCDILNAHRRRIDRSCPKAVRHAEFYSSTRETIVAARGEADILATRFKGAVVVQVPGVANNVVVRITGRACHGDTATLVDGIWSARIGRRRPITSIQRQPPFINAQRIRSDCVLDVQRPASDAALTIESGQWTSGLEGATRGRSRDCRGRRVIKADIDDSDVNAPGVVRLIHQGHNRTGGTYQLKHNLVVKRITR